MEESVASRPNGDEKAVREKKKTIRKEISRERERERGSGVFLFLFLLSLSFVRSFSTELLAVAPGE